MLSKKIEILTRALQRERKAKEIAEGIIENRLRELYDSNQSLTQDIIQKEEFQKNLIDNLVDALIVFDFDMNILKINKQERIKINLLTGFLIQEKNFIYLKFNSQLKLMVKIIN